MKIAHICLSLGLGGAEKLLVDTLPEYKKLGHEVSIIQLSSKLEEKGYLQLMKFSNIEVITLGSKGFISPLFIIKISKILNKEQYDIVHVHLFPNLYYLSIIRMLGLYKGVLVFTEHSTKNGRSDKVFFRFIEPYIYKRYNKIVAISGNVKCYLNDLLPKLKDKITLINNGVHISKFRKAIPYNKSIFLNDEQVSKDCTLLLMVSRFSEPKDQLTLIKAMQFLDDNYILLLVGEGENLNVCKRASIKFGNRVQFLGFRNDIPELMKTVDMNILSSSYEGFSGVTLESLSSEKPFLGADVPGINDIVPDKDFLFELGNEEELAKKIIFILNTDKFRESMINKAAEHVEQFDRKNMINRHLDMYLELLNENG